MKAVKMIAVMTFALPFAALASNSPAGVGNFEKVNDQVYRGAQPTSEGFQNLARLGIHTVIDLQESDSARAANEAKAVNAAGMEYIGIPMEGMHTPSNESIAKALSVLENTTSGPVFVHCHRGADRTGGVIACYRIEHDHWANDKALSEARSMGMSWYQLQIQRYVQHFTPKTDNTPSVASASALSTLAPTTAAAVLIP